MPTIRRHPEFESWFYDTGRIHLSRPPRTQLHVSDLLVPRKAYWSRIAPRETTDREVGYFLAGRGHEDAFTALARIKQYRKVEGEWLGTEEFPFQPGDGIMYQVDAVVPSEGGHIVPFELKTNRRPTIVSDEKVAEEHEMAVRQLAIYSAILGHTTSYLLQLHLMARNLAIQDGVDTQEVDAQADIQEDEDETSGSSTAASDDAESYVWLRKAEPRLVTYQIDWTRGEQAEILRQAAIDKITIQTAVNTEDYRALRECPPWMCGRVYVKKENPFCPKCGTVYTIGETRADGKKRGVLKKCETCRPGPAKKDRIDLVRPSKEVFVPTCKFWSLCRPTENWAKYVDDYWRPSRP